MPEMIDRNRATAMLALNSPTLKTDIVRFESAAGFELPAQYSAFLMSVGNGGEGPVGSTGYLVLWKLEELKEMNLAYNVAEYAPGFLFFGSDGGGEAFAFDTRTEKWPVVTIPFVGMKPELAVQVGTDFDDFLARLSAS